MRVTVPSMAHAKALAEIKQKLAKTYQIVPLVADVHHNGMKIALEVAKHVDKVRINPGLYVFEKPKADRTEYSKAEFEEIGQKNPGNSRTFSHFLARSRKSYADRRKSWFFG